MSNKEILEDIKAAKECVCELGNNEDITKQAEETFLRVLDWAEAKAKETDISGPLSELLKAVKPEFEGAKILDKISTEGSE